MIKETRGVYSEKDKPLRLATVELKQQLADDEVLVNIHSAPINPSDISFAGGAAFMKVRPTFVGFEASGFVCAAGQAVESQALKGRRVAIFPSNDPDCLGSWGEFTVIKARHVYPLLDSVSYEDGASSIINPLTAQGLMNQVRDAGHTSIVAGAAASALGKMLIRLCKKYGMKIVCLVRKAGYVEELRQLGADHVVVTSAEDYHSQLDQAFAAAKPTAYLDPVAGAEGSFVVSKLPPNSLTIIYGTLAKEAYTLAPGDILFGQKIITGFNLNARVSSQKHGPAIVAEGFQNIADGLMQTSVVQRFEIGEFEAAIAYWHEHPTGQGKVLLFNKNFREASI